MYSLPSASQMREPCAANDERRIAADRAERADGRIDAAGDHGFGSLLQAARLFCFSGHACQSAA